MKLYIEFKPGQKFAAKNASISKDIDTFSDCGYLLEDHEVVIDIDSIEKSTIKALITDFNIDTQVVWTDRGAHLYFEKPRDFVRAKNGPCALGFEIETKTKKNTPRGITVRRNGITREIEGAGKRQELPWYFYSHKQYSNLYGMDEGRNNALFAHKHKLDNHSDSLKILRFINTELFDKPLDENEFMHACRDYEAGDDGKKAEYEIANNIMNSMKCVNYHNCIWWWENGRFVTGGEDPYRFKEIIFHYCPGKTTKFVDEVERQVLYRGKKEKLSSYPIRLKNGILNDGEFIETSSYGKFTPYYIDIDYLKDAEPVKEIDEYIDNVTGSDSDYKKLLLEVMAYVMITDPETIRTMGRFFMFRGDGANGKGTLLQIMKKIYGEDNCTALSIKDIADMRYQITLIGKLANLGDDVQPEAINNDQMKILKNISTADTVATRQLYKHSSSATITAKLYFTTNSDIRSFEKGYAYKRRVMWLPMFNRVEKPDRKFITRMTAEKALQYWMRLIVEAYFRLYERGTFTDCAVVEEYNKEYHIANNYMAMFLETVDIEVDIIEKTGPEVKQLYWEYNDDDSKPYRPRLLLEALKGIGIGQGIKNINGKRRRVFLRQADTKQKIL